MRAAPDLNPLISKLRLIVGFRVDADQFAFL